MGFNFEWDEEKASLNYKKHKVDFEEATTVFLDPFSMTIPDPETQSSKPDILIWVCLIKGGC